MQVIAQQNTSEINFQGTDEIVEWTFRNQMTSIIYLNKALLMKTDH